MIQSKKKITVIGGGIIGICCGLSLLEKGLRVRLIDEGELTRKASYGNAGVISPWSCVPQSMPGTWKHIPKWVLDKSGPVSFHWSYLPVLLPWAVKFLAAGQPGRVVKIAAAMDALNKPNIRIYRQHLSNTNHQNLIKDSSYLHVYRSKGALNSDSLEYKLRHENQASMEIINARKLQEIEPAISTQYQSAMLIKNQARAISPGRLVEVLTLKFKESGGELVHARVENIAQIDKNQWRILMPGQQLKTELLLIAAGPWSAELLKPLGVKLPLVNERGYHLEFHQPGVELNHSVLDVKSNFVVSSMSAGIRSAGTAEFAKLDAKPNYRRAKIFKKLTKQLLPDLNTNATSQWMGTRPSFPDSLPVIGQVPGFIGLYAAFGHSHYGLGMAPKTGQTLAEIVMGDSSDIDLTPYRLDRFNV